MSFAGMESRGKLAAEPFRIGWASAKANVVPMIVLWTLAAGLALAYYFLPGFASLLEPLARWQTQSGWVAAFLNRFVFCGVLPGLFMLALPALRPARRPVATVLLTALFCGVFGILTDAFFRLQCRWFGAGHDLATLLAKTAVDQFAWNVLVVTPCVSAFYFWAACGFSLRETRTRWPGQWPLRVFAPSLIANWCVWIPAVAATYAFPQPLQVQVSGIISAYWTLVCLKIGSTSERRGRA